MTARALLGQQPTAVLTQPSCPSSRRCRLRRCTRSLSAETRLCNSRELMPWDSRCLTVRYIGAQITIDAENCMSSRGQGGMHPLHPWQYLRDGFATAFYLTQKLPGYYCIPFFGVATMGGALCAGGNVHGSRKGILLPISDRTPTGQLPSRCLSKQTDATDHVSQIARLCRQCEGSTCAAPCLKPPRKRPAARIRAVIIISRVVDILCLCRCALHAVLSFVAGPSCGVSPTRLRSRPCASLPAVVGGLTEGAAASPSRGRQRSTSCMSRYCRV